MNRIRRDQRGVAAVEAAIAIPIVMFLIFGIFESAFLARAHLAASDGANAGVRAAAVAGSDVAADADVLSAVRRATSAQAKNALIRVIVYKASGPTGQLPSACLSGPQAGCNVYSGADLNAKDQQFEDDAIGAADSWPAESRGTSISAGPDYIGVYVETKCGCAKDMGFPQVLKSTSIARIEPNSA